MLLTFCAGFLGSLFGGMISGYLVKRHLIPGPSEGILEGVTPRALKRTSQKRVPRALTDLMAYNRELEEEGENRG